MKSIFSSLLLFVMIFSNAFGQIAANPEHFTVFDGMGKQVNLNAITSTLGQYDVVFLGEYHDDAVGHAIQAEVFQTAVNQFAGKRKVSLSLEMFERDVQIVLNEYLAGQISENHFMLSSRPWGNYKTDYRPMVELAKEKKLEVVAANAPRRYVNMVSRGGRDSLASLSPDAKKWIAPLPYADASDAYSKKFKALMGSSGEAAMGLDNILSSQSLWDATMAYWVAESLGRNKGSLVVHLNGGFHTEARLGTVEHLLKYKPDARVMVVTIRYEKDFKTFDSSKHTGLGDLVILTDFAQPRSKR